MSAAFDLLHREVDRLLNNAAVRFRHDDPDTCLVGIREAMECLEAMNLIAADRANMDMWIAVATAPTPTEGEAQ